MMIATTLLPALCSLAFCLGFGRGEAPANRVNTGSDSNEVRTPLSIGKALELLAKRSEPLALADDSQCRACVHLPRLPGPDPENRMLLKIFGANDAKPLDWLGTQWRDWERSF